MLPRWQELEALRVGDKVDGGPCKGLGADQEVKVGLRLGTGRQSLSRGSQPSCNRRPFVGQTVQTGGQHADAVWASGSG